MSRRKEKRERVSVCVCARGEMTAVYNKNTRRNGYHRTHMHFFPQQIDLMYSHRVHICDIRLFYPFLSPFIFIYK